MLKITEHRISFFDDTGTTVIPVVQGDTGRVLKFTPTDAELTASYTAKWFVLKPSGKAVYYNATITGGSVYIQLTAQALAEKGDAYLNIRVYDTNEDVVSAFRVCLQVQVSPVDAIESTNETNIFDEAVAEAMEEIGTILDPTLSIQNKAADAKATGDRLDAVVEPYGTNRKSILQAAILQYGGKTYINEYGGQTSMSAIAFDSSKWNETALSKLLTGVITSIAAPFSTLVTYNTGSWMVRNGKLYRCKEDGVTGAWNSSKWQSKNIGDMIIEFISARVTLTEDNDGFINISIGS